MNKKILSGSTIKIIAVITMCIDHFGQVVLKNGVVMNAPYKFFNDAQFSALLSVVDLCHMLGRVAFPLFCYLLVEGFIHTHNLRRYILNLGLFAIVSEPIYDLTFYGSVFSSEGQNVLFTLLIGILTLTCIRKLNDNIWVAIFFTFISGSVAYILRLDGWYYGAIMITVMYMFRRHKFMKYLLTAVVMYFCELDYSLKGLLDPYFWMALLSLFIMVLYNGQRGMKIKYFFYIFYPGHLLFLYVLTTFIIVPQL